MNQTAKQQAGKRQHPVTKQVQARNGTEPATPQSTGRRGDPKPSHEGRRKQKTARERANPPTTGRQATETSHKAGTSTKQPETSRPTDYRQRKAGKRQEPATGAGRSTKRRNQPNHKVQAGKRQKASHETCTSTKRREHEPDRKEQAGKSQEPATKQPQSRYKHQTARNEQTHRLQAA